MKVYKPRRLNKCLLQRMNFSVRVVNAWNCLPDNVTSVATVNSFKNRLTNTSTDMGHKRHLPKSYPHHANVISFT